MPDKTDRGTTADPAWGTKSLTGGNDSGASRIDRNKLDEVQGPDLTAKLLEESGGSPAGNAADAPRAEHLYYPGPDAAGTQQDTDSEEVTDESGRIAPADVGDVPGARGGARDLRVTGLDS